MGTPWNLFFLSLLLGSTLKCSGEDLLLCSGKPRTKKVPVEIARFRRSLMRQLDPCQHHSTIQDDGRRSSKVRLEDDDTPISDQDMHPGWYLLQSQAGSFIPREPPDQKMCSTNFPIWLREPNTDPPVGTTVDGIACQVNRISDCAEEIPIKVKTCPPTGLINEAFVVYHLTAPGVDKSAYCVGDKARCPEGTGSITGFEPCRAGAFPGGPINPTVNYKTHVCVRQGDREAKYTAIVFNCVVNTHETGVNFDVWWYMDNQMVKEERNIPKNKMPAELHEDEWIPKRKGKGMGQTIHCRVTAKYDEIGVPSPLTASPNMGIGFEINADSQVVKVTEGQANNKAKIIVRPKLPILCPPGSEDSRECDMQIELRSPDTTKHPGKCSIDDDNRQMVFKNSRCRKYIEYKADNVNQAIPIEIQAVTDGRTDSDYTGVIKFEIGTHFNHPAWNDYKFPPIQVTVADETSRIAGKVCSSNDDPHMTTFDGRYYECHYPGEYVMYRNSLMSLQVNGFYKKCSYNSAACNCGVAVRAGRNVFIVDDCGGSRKETINGQPNPNWKPVRIGQEGCDEDVLKVNRIGRSYTIKLPTGTKVNYVGYSIRIIPTINDWQTTEGLCGTLNGNRKDDFKLSDDTYVYNNDESNKYDYNDKEIKRFTESWRIPKGDKYSLYNPNINELDPMHREEVACVCEKIGGIETIKCGLFEDNNICDTLDGRGLPHYDNCRKKRSTSYHDLVDDFDSTLSFDGDDDTQEYDFRNETFTPSDGEWRNGWSEESATIYCNELVKSSKMTAMCSGLQNVHVDDAVDMCILDIKTTGDTMFAPTALGVIQGECKTEMGFNISLWTRDDTKNFTGPPTDIVETICPSNCNLQGNCINGTCECYEGLEGEDCTVNSTAPPEAYNIPQRALCDLQIRPCLQTPVVGENFKESENLTCRIQFAKFNGSKFGLTGYVQINKADYEHYQQIHCPLPNTRIMRRSLKTKESIAPRAYIIRVSNNKILYSLQELMFTVYNSKCHICPETGKCTWKENICVIDGECYNEGEFPQPGKTCLVCRPELSTSSWTRVKSTCLIDGDCYNHNDAKFETSCLKCNTSNSDTMWTMQDGTCYIKNGTESRCYNIDEIYPGQECAKCLPAIGTTEWSIDENKCFIGSVCRENGFVQPEVSCSVCDSKRDQTSWTVTDGNCNIEGRCYINGTKASPVSCLYCHSSELPNQWSVQAGSCFIDDRCMNDTTTHTVHTCKECMAEKSQNTWLIKNGSCFINNVCHTSESANGRLNCMICDPNKNTTSWIQKPSTCLIDDNCYEYGQDSPYSTCLHCSPSKNTWIMKERRCLINGFCYKEGETSPGDECKICQPGESTNDWTFDVGNVVCREEGPRTSTTSMPSTTSYTETTDQPINTNQSMIIGISVGVGTAVLVVLVILTVCAVKKCKRGNVRKYGATESRERNMHHGNPSYSGDLDEDSTPRPDYN